MWNKLFVYFSCKAVFKVLGFRFFYSDSYRITHLTRAHFVLSDKHAGRMPSEIAAPHRSICRASTKTKSASRLHTFRVHASALQPVEQAISILKAVVRQNTRPFITVECSNDLSYSIN